MQVSTSHWQLFIGWFVGSRPVSVFKQSEGGRIMGVNRVYLNKYCIFIQRKCAFGYCGDNGSWDNQDFTIQSKKMKKTI